MFSGATYFCGTTSSFSVKNENAQTRKVITEKYKPKTTLTVRYNGTTTLNFFNEFIR